MEKCNHCFCIPFYHGKGCLKIEYKMDFQCCKCGKDKYGLTKREEKELRRLINEKGFE